MKFKSICGEWFRHPGQTVADCVCLFLRDLSRKETFVLRLDKNQNLEGSGRLKLFRTKRQTQLFSHINHNMALQETIFAMPCCINLEKTVEVGYFLTNSVVFLFLAGQHLLCPNSFWCRDWTKEDGCSRLKISIGNLICFHKYPHNIKNF